jgi:beta-lactamase class A
MADTASLNEGIVRATTGLGYTFGVAVKYLESGAEMQINGNQRFALASVFKVPVLVTAARRIDAGALRLDQRVTFADRMKTAGSGLLAYLGAGLNLSLKDLLLLMIIISDNTATDMVVNLVGGPAAVDSTMRDLGFAPRELHISGDVHDLFGQSRETGQPALIPSEMKARMQEMMAARQGAPAADETQGNVATPLAMVRLFEMIFGGRAASRQACDLALDILLHQTLNDRLPSMLPFGTDVAHKTGTMMGSVNVRNDSGIIYVSPSVHAVVSVFARRDEPPSPEQLRGPAMREEGHRVDRAFGEIGRLVYESAATLG